MRVIVFLFIILSTSETFSQVTRTTTSTSRISGKVYHKITNDKIRDKELNDIIQQHPGIVFEKVINKYGEIEKFLYDPDNILVGRQRDRSEDKQIKIGELFPEFVFRTTNKEVIASKDLTDTWVLIRFELFAGMRNKNQLLKLDNQIKDLESNQKLVPIICFPDSEKKIRDEIDHDKSIFKLVGDARNFHEKFNIVTLPTTILLDQNLRVFGYFFNGDKIDLKALL